MPPAFDRPFIIPRLLKDTGHLLYDMETCPECPETPGEECYACKGGLAVCALCGAAEADELSQPCKPEAKHVAKWRCAYCRHVGFVIVERGFKKFVDFARALKAEHQKLSPHCTAATWPSKYLPEWKEVK